MDVPKKSWSRPTIVALDNNIIQTGGSPGYFETALACSGPVFGTTSNPGPGNDPDCGAITGYAYIGSTGTLTTLAASGDCFGACS